MCIRDRALADGADRRHVRNAVLLNYLLQRLRARQSALHPKLNQVIRQQSAAAATAKGVLMDRVRRHVHEMCTGSTNQVTGYRELPARGIAQA